MIINVHEKRWIILNDFHLDSNVSDQSIDLRGDSDVGDHLENRLPISQICYHKLSRFETPEKVTIQFTQPWLFGLTLEWFAT